MKRHFTWDPASKRIISDNEWKYQITPSGKSYDFIQRTNSRGEKESWFKDVLSGRETIESSNGVKTIKTWFPRGKMAGKVRSIVSVRNQIETVSYRASYDENGEVIREERNGNDIEYVRKSNEKKVTATSKGKLLWIKNYKENHLISIENSDAKALFDYSNGNISNVRIQTEDGRAYIYSFDSKSGLLDLNRTGDLKSSMSKTVEIEKTTTENINN